jgi:hypothetical protein
MRKVVTPDQWRAIIIIIFCSATLLCLEDVKVGVMMST